MSILHTSALHASRTAAEWSRVLAAYRHPSNLRSVLEIVVTVVPLVLLWVAAWLALSVGYWLTLLICIPAAAFLVRLFLIGHDCGHGAFFHTRAANDWVGRIIGVFTLTPYAVWRRTHAAHHAGSGELASRGMGDIRTLTVAEYRALTPWRQRLYRLYRNPLVLFGIGPAWVFLLQQRLPIGLMRSGPGPWISAMGTNLAIVAFAAVMMWAIGVVPFLGVHVPIVLLAASIGVWLFYVQHQFEDTYWAERPDWTHAEAALHGSSYYDLPAPLRWLTANIGVHHVHHLYSRIPYYRLQTVLRDHAELASIGRITLRESLACVRLRLWCDERRRLVTLKEI